MGTLGPGDLTVFFLGLATLLGLAHAFGEGARRLGQPMVIGEMVAGLLLGPTVLEAIAPRFQAWLFPATGPAAVALDAVVALAVALLLLVAGLEVDLSVLWRGGWNHLPEQTLRPRLPTSPEKERAVPLRSRLLSMMG
jgi:Kef-type K+ transport system membrane component KefB